LRWKFARRRAHFWDLSTAGPEIDDATERAIMYVIGHEMGQLGATIHGYIIEQQSGSRNRALALHRGYAHLQADLVPEMLSRLITHCLDLGLLDADLVTGKIRMALEPQLKALGQSVGVSHQSPGTGTTTRQIMNFQGWVTAFCAGIASRVHVAVEKRRHMASPAPVIGPGGHTFITFGGSGPLQLFQGSPGSSATIQQDAAGAVRRGSDPAGTTPAAAAPAEPPARAPPSVAAADPHKGPFWRWTERTNWLLGSLGAIAAVIAVVLVFRPPNSAAPALIAPAPVSNVPALPEAPPPPAPSRDEQVPEQPKVRQAIRHARRPIEKADYGEPKTTSTTPPSSEPETRKPATASAAAAPPASPVPVTAATPVPPPPQPTPPPARPIPPPQPDPLIDNYGDSARANSPAECPKILKMCEAYFGGPEFECKFAYQQCKDETAGTKDYYWWSAGRGISYGAIPKGSKLPH
jgi:hypothetical protein